MRTRTLVITTAGIATLAAALVGCSSESANTDSLGVGSNATIVVGVDASGTGIDDSNEATTSTASAVGASAGASSDATTDATGDATDDETTTSHETAPVTTSGRPIEQPAMSAATSTTRPSAKPSTTVATPTTTAPTTAAPTSGAPVNTAPWSTPEQRGAVVANGVYDLSGVKRTGPQASTVCGETSTMRVRFWFTYQNGETVAMWVNLIDDGSGYIAIASDGYNNRLPWVIEIDISATDAHLECYFTTWG